MTLDRFLSDLCKSAKAWNLVGMNGRIRVYDPVHLTDQCPITALADIHNTHEWARGAKILGLNQMLAYKIMHTADGRVQVNGFDLVGLRQDLLSAVGLKEKVK